MIHSTFRYCRTDQSTRSWSNDVTVTFRRDLAVKLLVLGGWLGQSVLAMPQTGANWGIASTLCPSHPHQVDALLMVIASSRRSVTATTMWHTLSSHNSNLD